MNVGGDCKTQSGESLNVSEITALEVHIPKKRLTPYNVFQFTLSCNKGDKTNEASAIYMITELDLP